MKRRRFLSITASTIPLSLVSCDRINALGKKGSTDFTWKGVLFNSNVEITFLGITKEQASLVLPTVIQKMFHLESQFSLYQPASLISELNRKGSVRANDGAFTNLVIQSLRFAQKTDGLFDPTIQSYWTKLRDAHANGYVMTPGEIETALSLVNYRNVRINGLETSFSEENMALTLNGIAQGYITDQVTELLKKANLPHTLVNLGEYRALNPREGSKPWKIHLRDGGKNGQLSGQIVELSEGALAVSCGAGYRFSATKDAHHLINPHTGACQPVERTIAIKAPDAMTADMLSTACAVSPPERAAGIIERFSGCELLYDTMIS